jgi:aspartate/methionine/tyrosine aminotransferase
LEAIIAIAEKHKLPLIADEIYGGQVGGEEARHCIAM